MFPLFPLTTPTYRHCYLSFSGRTSNTAHSYLTQFFFFTATQFRILLSHHANCRFCHPTKNCGFPLIYPTSLTAPAYVSSSCSIVNCSATCGRTTDVSLTWIWYCCKVKCYMVRTIFGIGCYSAA